MLTQIFVRNLGCFGDADHQLNLSPETLLVGPNNVGKSIMVGTYNYVRTLHLTRSLQYDTTSYRWGSIENIAHNHQFQRGVRAGANFSGRYNGMASIEYRANQNWVWNPQALGVELQDELRNGWYFAPSRNEVQPNLQVGYNPQSTAWAQPLDPFGSNVITYLLERFTSRDPRWNVAEEWLKRIDPKLSILKSPLRGSYGSIETQQASGVDINMAYQGTGIQKTLTVIAGVVFSPEGSTIVIEEPEIHLHPRSQEIIVDLFNTAVNDWHKQVIFTAHSWNMLLPFISDIGEGTKRGSHPIASPDNFRLVTFSQDVDDVEIKDYDLKGKNFRTVRDDFKKLWG
jgi:AAA ATPase domain